MISAHPPFFGTEKYTYHRTFPLTGSSSFNFSVSNIVTNTIRQNSYNYQNQQASEVRYIGIKFISAFCVAEDVKDKELMRLQYFHKNTNMTLVGQGSTVPDFTIIMISSYFNESDQKKVIVFNHGNLPDEEVLIKVNTYNSSWESDPMNVTMQELQGAVDTTLGAISIRYTEYVQINI